MIALVCAVVLGLVLSTWIFAKPLLCVDSGPPQPAEAIILLGGGVFDRAPRAAELFKAGLASRIIVTGKGDCDENRLALIARGVPKAAIQLERRSTTTRENAQFTQPLLAAAGIKKAIIVTSWYHSRRAVNTFRAIIPTVKFTVSPSSRSDRERLRTTLARVYKEYGKIGWYWLRWGVPPWQTKSEDHNA